MFRMILPILMALAFSGASMASAVHSLNHGSEHHSHQSELAGDETMEASEMALAKCCETAGSTGSSSCIADLFVSFSVAPTVPMIKIKRWATRDRSDFSSVTESVPTGPPKV